MPKWTDQTGDSSGKTILMAQRLTVPNGIWILDTLVKAMLNWKSIPTGKRTSA
jgi:hypothetical protein